MSHLITTNKIYRSTLLTGAVLLGISPHLQAQTDGGLATVSINGTPAVANQVIVKLRNTIEKSDGIALQAELQAQTVEQFSEIGVQLWQVNGDVASLIQNYQADPRIEYIEPNYLLKLDAVPNDPEFPKLWGLDNANWPGGTVDADIDAPEAWDFAIGKSNPPIVMAVIDSGVDYKHPDLVANMWINPGENFPPNGGDKDGKFGNDVYGYDFANVDADPMDIDGHGTHVAGIIAAVGDNKVGVTGVNWQAKIMSLKICRDPGGECPTIAAIKAIDYAISKKAKIISASWSYESPFVYSQALYDAINRAKWAGILVVTAAGNDALDNDKSPYYPASYDLSNIIAVAATDPNDNLAWYSNYGIETVDLGAPGGAGGDILSTIPIGIALDPAHPYGSKSGTSMAAAYVAGVASLLWACQPTKTFTEIRQRILDTVDHKLDLTGKIASGGRLNAHNAVKDFCTGNDGKLPESCPAGVKDGPPVAKFTHKFIGNCVELDGSASVACTAGAELVSYIWESGLISGMGDILPENKSPKICFDEPGEYRFTLTVVDSKGRSGSYSETYTISLPLPELGMGEDIRGGFVPDTKFRGGISVNKSGYAQKATLKLDDPVKVAGTIVVDKADHVGQKADIFVYADTTLWPEPHIFQFMMDEKLGIYQWDGNPTTLVPYISNVTLEKEMTVSLYKGKFFYPGTLKIFFGYRLKKDGKDGAAIKNSLPIEIIINP